MCVCVGNDNNNLSIEYELYPTSTGVCITCTYTECIRLLSIMLQCGLSTYYSMVILGIAIVISMIAFVILKATINILGIAIVISMIAFVILKATINTSGGLVHLQQSV